jgi:hypothetical protein
VINFWGFFINFSISPLVGIYISNVFSLSLLGFPFPEPCLYIELLNLMKYSLSFFSISCFLCLAKEVFDYSK